MADVDKAALKQVFTHEIAQKKFSMSALVKATSSIPSNTELMSSFEKAVEGFSTKAKEHVFKGLLRNCFLIELVKADVTSTKMEVRWAERLDSDDPRWLSFDGCLELFTELMTRLASYSDRNKDKLFSEFYLKTAVPYELPLDYVARDAESGIHRLNNLQWLPSDLPLKVAGMRQFLMSLDDARHRNFFRKAYNKIQVKAYLTDRALTGVDKTNREKRWETHPRGVQFALHRECMDIEYRLINQICHFESFPGSLKAVLKEKNLLEPLEEPFRCPITMEAFQFDTFEQGILEPIHGKANFQVGHLNPLKAESDDPHVGHTALNISWISSDGNRIQGDMSLNEVRRIIIKIAKNYEDAGVL